MSRRKRRRAHRYGVWAERLACLYLRAKGYRILATRYRRAGAEIDIVARKAALLVLIEVKARRRLEDCAESVTPEKQMRLARAAEMLLSDARIVGLASPEGHSVRFDLIGIAPFAWPRHTLDAWRLS